MIITKDFLLKIELNCFSIVTTCSLYLFTICKFITYQSFLVHKLSRINLTFRLWSLWLKFKFKTSLICCLLLRVKLIIPSFNIRSNWSLKYLFRNVIYLLFLHLLTIIWLDSIIIIFLISFFLNKKWSETSSFLSWGKIIFKQLVQIFIININCPFLILEVLFWSSFFLNLWYILLNLFTIKCIHHRPKEITFWKSLFFSMWIW